MFCWPVSDQRFHFVPQNFLNNRNIGEECDKKVVPKNFSKFTGKHHCRDLFLVSCRHATFLKEISTGVDSQEFCKILKISFFADHLHPTITVFVAGFGRAVKNPHLTHIPPCVSNFLFLHQIIALQKLWKMLFISSKKLFSFSRYSNVCNFPFHAFQIQKDKWKWNNL